MEQTVGNSQQLHSKYKTANEWLTTTGTLMILVLL